MSAGPIVKADDVLYLDFDGVLHHEAVYVDGQGQPYMHPEFAEGHRLFEWVHHLDELLAPYPDMKIVLSTTWAVQLGFEVARSRLPESLRKRVIGCTYMPAVHGVTREQKADFNATPRGFQVQYDVLRRRPRRWLAIDDEINGWAGAEDHLIPTDGKRGLGWEEARAYLAHCLQQPPESTLGYLELERKVLEIAQGKASKEDTEAASAHQGAFWDALFHPESEQRQEGFKQCGNFIKRRVPCGRFLPSLLICRWEGAELDYAGLLRAYFMAGYFDLNEPLQQLGSIGRLPPGSVAPRPIEAAILFGNTFAAQALFELGAGSDLDLVSLIEMQDHAAVSQMRALATQWQMDQLLNTQIIDLQADRVASRNRRSTL